MGNCNCGHTHHHEDIPHSKNSHINAFLDLNGIPFIKAEYMDKRDFGMVDSSLIKSEIFIDQSESMRAIVDIRIDDIGRRADNGALAVVGNISKQKKLIESINVMAERFEHQLDVIKPGIIMRVNYQLESVNTQKVIRSMVEDIRIPNASYFTNINKNDINDNAIIVNFNDCKVSTINEFTHGRDRMNLRITNIQMFYECLKREPKMYDTKQSLMSSQIQPLPTHYCCESDYYQYQKDMQRRHIIGMPGCECGDYNNEQFCSLNPMWSMFSRYYHFSNNGNDIIIHDNEVNDPLNKTILIPCGIVQVNRLFAINPGHRIIFKFNVWKNDMVVMNDTTRVAIALKAPVFDGSCDCHEPEPDHTIDPDYETIIRMLEKNRKMDQLQNDTINQVIMAVNEIKNQIKYPYQDDCCCEDNKYEKVLEKLEELENKINKLHDITPDPNPDQPDNPDDDKKCDCGCDCDDISLLPIHLIDEVIDETGDKTSTDTKQDETKTDSGETTDTETKDDGTKSDNENPSDGN